MGTKSNDSRSDDPTIILDGRLYKPIGKPSIEARADRVKRLTGLVGLNLVPTDTYKWKHLE